MFCVVARLPLEVRRWLGAAGRKPAIHDHVMFGEGQGAGRESDGVLLNVLTYAAGFPVPGLLGGSPGPEAPLRCEGVSPLGGTAAAVLVELMRADQRVVMESAGGSGFGDAARRSPGAAERGLADGYVTSSPRNG